MSQTVTSTSAPRQILVYDGDIGDLFGVFLLNLIFTIITFGVFRFWAITRMRRYLWSHMRLEDTRFTYTGKGRELFFGFVLAMLFLFVVAGGLIAAAFALREVHPGLMAIPMIVAYLGIFILFGAAHFSAQRYRLSRTEWRGIRGGMTGSALRYGLSWLLYLVLVVVTLYQATPWMQVGLARWRINASRFGSAQLRCEGRARHLYLTFLATFAGTLVLAGVIAAIVAGSEFQSLSRAFSEGGPGATLAIRRALPVIIIGVLLFLLGSGLLMTWYYTKMLRLLLGNTTAVVPGPRGDDTLQFSTTVTPGSLLWLTVSNMLIALVTFGFGVPIVLHRTARYITRTTLMSGTFDADHLVQSTLARPSLGEGFLQALDPGIF